MAHISIKKLFSGSLLLVFIAFVANAANATNSKAYYYKFSGHVKGIHDGGGLVAASNVSLGDFVSYIFRVDFSSAASATRNSDGEQRFFGDYKGVNRFQADLISGEVLDGAGDYYASNGYGYSNVSYGESGRNGLHLQGGSSDQGVYIYRTNSGHLRAKEWAYNDSGQKSAIYSKVWVSHVSESVPELDAAGAPIAFALIAGIAGIAFERRRKKVAV